MKTTIGEGHDPTRPLIISKPGEDIGTFKERITKTGKWNPETGTLGKLWAKVQAKEAN